MSKLKLKEGVNAKGVVSYRKPGKSAMSRVVLGEATQAQLSELHKLGHPFVVEAKEVIKK